MSKFDIGLFVFMVGVGMAVCFDSVAVSDGGLVITGIGLGMLKHASEGADKRTTKP
jgi:hypothetical protein